MKSYNGSNTRSTTPRKQKSSKENADPNTMRSPLPPRPPSASLKRKLAIDSATPPPDSRAAAATASSSSAAGYSDSGVKVVVRVRPPNKNEEEGEAIVQKASNDTLTIAGHTFTFDSVADTEATQVDIFELVGAPLVENCLAGFNSSVFAYGQTGSGKTYTIWGPANALSQENPLSDQQGLTPRVFQRLFARISEEQTKHSDKQLIYQCRCSFLEIYNEQITDLLDPTQKNLQIREDVKTGVYVENLTEEYVSTMKDVTQLLIKGFSNRRIGATSINAESSRSHSVFTCVVESRYKRVEDGLSCFKTSRINLVDLAGSERQKLTGAAGERLKEAGNINRSLSQLGNLINILAEVSHSGKQRHVPYRDSKLTFLLQESLGGNAKLAMICAISPAQSCKSETFSTLRFAQRAKAIKNKAVVNEETQDDVNVLREVIRQLKEELLRMKANGSRTDQNENFSSRWNARRSLNLLKSLNRPMIPHHHVDDDSDEEMEIVEEAEDNAQQVSELQSSEQGISLEFRPRVYRSTCEDQKCSEDTDVDMEEAVEPSDKNETYVEFAELENCPKPGIPSRNICNEGRNISDSSVEDTPTRSEESAGNSKNPTDLSIVPSDVSPIPKSPTPSVSPRVKSSRKSLRTSSSLTATQKSIANTKLDSEAAYMSSAIPTNSFSLNSLSTQMNSLNRAPTESLAASLHRGLEIIDSHRKSAALRQSTFRFSCKLADMKDIVPVPKVDIGVQTLQEDRQSLEDVANASLCSKCKTMIYPDELKYASEDPDMQLVAVNPDMQLVPVNGLESCDKNQIPKAVEKVLAGAIRREMALEEICTKQNAEIMQLKRLVQQYKHERECNAIISQTREDKIVRLESLMDGILSTEEFMDEELLSLVHEHKLLKEKYENHPEVLRVKIELQRVQDELEQYRNFFDMGERDVLLEEIQDLRSQLQSYIDSSLKLSKKRSTSLLQLTYTSEPSVAPSLSTVPESMEEAVELRVEQERIKWTEAESKWVTLVEELRLELEANRMLSQRQKQELDTERKCLEELKEAMQLAMEGHARMLEQYAELEEKHIQLLARHRKIRDGIEDVKKAAAKAGVRGAESRFINAVAAEISALKVEREKERRYFRDENRGLQAQLRDTAEAVQAAGELLVRLKEAEETIAAAENRAIDAEQETVKAYKQIDKLKKKHEKEINALNQLLGDSCLPKEASKAVYNDFRTATYDADSCLSREASKPVYDDLKMASYDAASHLPEEASKPVYDDDFRTASYDADKIHSAGDQQWKEEFAPFYNGEQEVLSKLGEQPSSWFSGYDRCNI